MALSFGSRRVDLIILFPHQYICEGILVLLYTCMSLDKGSSNIIITIFISGYKPTLATLYKNLQIVKETPIFIKISKSSRLLFRFGFFWYNLKLLACTMVKIFLAEVTHVRSLQKITIFMIF